MKKSYRDRFFNLSLVFFLVIGLLLPYNSFSRTVYASEIPVIIPPDIDDVTDTVSVLLPMVISSSNNTSLVKYNPWKNKIKAAINTLITLGVYNLVQVANDLGVTVSSLVGGTVTFSYNTYRFINDVWKTIKETDGITDNSTGSVSDGDTGSLPEGVLHYTPTYWASFGNSTLGSVVSGFFLSTDKNVYVTKLISDNYVMYNGPIDSLALRLDLFVPFTAYAGQIEEGKTYTFSVSSSNDTDYESVVNIYRATQGNVPTGYTTAINSFSQDENSTPLNYNPNGLPAGSYLTQHKFSNDITYSYSDDSNYDYYYVFFQRFKPYLDTSSYKQRQNSTTGKWFYPYNYTGSLSLINESGTGNKTVSVTDANVYPVQLYLNDFANKRTMSINGNNLGVIDYGGYTVGNSQPDVYNNPYYENQINYDGYSGDDWEELKELIIQSYDNGTQISDYTRQLYDVNTQQLVSIQNIDSTNNSILQLLLNGNEYTDGYINSQSDTLTDFDNITSDYYNYEDQFIDNFNDSLTDLQFENPSDWGSSFIASSNWVKEQYDRMTVNTQIGKVLGFSMALGFVLLLIGRLLR